MDPSKFSLQIANDAIEPNLENLTFTKLRVLFGQRLVVFGGLGYLLETKRLQNVRAPIDLSLDDRGYGLTTRCELIRVGRKQVGVRVEEERLLIIRSQAGGIHADWYFQKSVFCPTAPGGMRHDCSCSSITALETESVFRKVVKVDTEFCKAFWEGTHLWACQSYAAREQRNQKLSAFVSHAASEVITS